MHGGMNTGSYRLGDGWQPDSRTRFVRRSSRMNPNWEAFEQAVEIMVVATPFIFGVLSLFAGAVLLLSKVEGTKKNAH